MTLNLFFTKNEVFKNILNLSRSYVDLVVTLKEFIWDHKSKLSLSLLLVGLVHLKWLSDDNLRLLSLLLWLHWSTSDNDLGLIESVVLTISRALALTSFFDHFATAAESEHADNHNAETTSSAVMMTPMVSMMTMMTVMTVMAMMTVMAVVTVVATVAAMVTVVAMVFSSVVTFLVVTVVSVWTVMLGLSFSMFTVLTMLSMVSLTFSMLAVLTMFTMFTMLAMMSAFLWHPLLLIFLVFLNIFSIPPIFKSLQKRQNFLLIVRFLHGFLFAMLPMWLGLNALLGEFASKVIFDGRRQNDGHQDR